MSDARHDQGGAGTKTITVQDAVGTVLAHDITEIRTGEFKGAAFRKGHIVRPEDVCHLQRLGKDRLYVLRMADDEMHEDEAARTIAEALMGEGVVIQGEPREGKINILAARDGLLTVNAGALREFNMQGEVMCATLHTSTVVKQGMVVAGTRAIPLVVKKAVVEKAVRIAEAAKMMQDAGYTMHDKIPHASGIVHRASGVIEVKILRKPRAGVVITGNEVLSGRVKDSFAPVIKKKIASYGGEIIGLHYAPDDEQEIAKRLRDLLKAGADLLITTGGMSVDPDDVTRHAIRSLGATDSTYGSAVLPGAMVMVGYLSREHSAKSIERDPKRKERGSKRMIQEPSAPCAMPSAVIPILGIPACAMYHAITVFDLVLPRILAGERIGRSELAEMGHGGLCLNCDVCRYPVCPFGK